MPPASEADALAASAARALADLSAPDRLLIAVSGGADSVALLRLLAIETGRTFYAATVDHGLRAESRREAEEVGAWCGALGVPHTILTWAAPVAGAGLQAAAREARYALLAEEAARRGCGAVVVAHTADDQAETVFMRLARGSGVRGLSGMAAQSRIAAEAEDPVLLLRPLLGVGRAALRAHLLAIGQPFHDDPSNDDPRFERVRVRALLGALEEQALLGVDALARSAARLEAARRRADAADADTFAKAGGWYHRLGPAIVERPDDLARRGALCARLVHAVSGESHAPDSEAAAAAFARAIETGAATLGGAMVRRDGSRLVVLREPAALLGRRDGVSPSRPLRVPAGAGALWDGRFIVANPGPDEIEVAAFGDASHLGSARALFDLPDEALASAPAPALLGASARFQALTAERFEGGVVRFRKL